MKIYLAGGMKTDWQDRLMAAAPRHRYLDPRSHGITDPAEYTRWDLAAVAVCDVVVAQMDSSNPSGFGLSLEVGYAHALGKRVVFIDGIRGDWRSRYFDMVRQVSTVVESIEAAAAALAEEAT